MILSKKVIKLAPQTNDAIKKINPEWVWMFKTGDWIYCKENKKVVCLYYNKHHGSPPEKYTNLKTAIPILSWEKIEEILEEAGYWPEINKPHKLTKKDAECRIYQDQFGGYFYYGKAKTRQLAVMQAVIKLGEEVNK